MRPDAVPSHPDYPNIPLRTGDGRRSDHAAVIYWIYLNRAGGLVYAGTVFAAYPLMAKQEAWRLFGLHLDFEELYHTAHMSKPHRLTTTPTTR